MDFRWFSPADAKRFVALGRQAGLLIETAENKLAPGFDLSSVEVPIGFKPSKELLDIPDEIIEASAKSAQNAVTEAPPESTPSKTTEATIDEKAVTAVEETIEETETATSEEQPPEQAEMNAEGKSEVSEAEVEKSPTVNKPGGGGLDAFETKSLFLKIVDKIIEAKGFEKTKVISEINRRQDDLNVAIEVAGLLTARQYDIDITEFIDECREELINRDS